MNSSKSTVRKQLHFIFVLLLCLLPALFLFCGFILAPQYDDTYLGEMKYKLKLLENTPGKRIVMIGGSSVPFSMKSDLIAANFPDYKVIDFGLYADMGTVAMLDWANVNVQEGDIYLIMPEQNVQTLSSYFSGEDVWQALDGDFKHLSLLDSSRYEKLAAAFPSFAGRKLFYCINGTPTTDEIYARSSFNEYGDIAYANREYNIMDQGYNPNDLIFFSDSVITSDFIDEMNEFAQHVAEQGATVYYHFPAMNQLALTSDTTKASIDNYYNMLQNQLTFPILGNPHNSILESGWFYDTNFHLNDSGATYYTKLMIDDLKILFSDTSVIDIPDVSMPKSPVLAKNTELNFDNSDIECFTYESTDQGWIVTGLSSKGQSSAELIIPGVYKNKPIVGISETLFQNCDSLSQLTVQSNIGILYDNMFLNCSNFKALILTGAPSDYTIGNNLMSERSFLIYVPKNELDNYKRHYSWQKYDSYLTSSQLIHTP